MPILSSPPTHPTSGPLVPRPRESGSAAISPHSPRGPQPMYLPQAGASWLSKHLPTLPLSESSVVPSASLKVPKVPRTPSTNGSLTESPYAASASAGRQAQPQIVLSISDKFVLSPDPALWGADISPTQAEPDDELHNPDPLRDEKDSHGGSICTCRSLVNVGTLFLLSVGTLSLFAGYPVMSWIMRSKPSNSGGFGIGGINATGQVPSMPGNWGLIDLDTPREAHVKRSSRDGAKLQLVFSDEFNTPGRTFYPGDDPYWEAGDLHYWQTGNFEWYDPAAVITKDGYLEISLSRKETHDLHYQSGFISTWNKFCFTGGMMEASVSLPGFSNVAGLWPAIWTLGNLGRAGYGATLDGLWPYSYDACDVGTAPNQTRNGLPLAATTGGDLSADGVLSYQLGQRLSRCTCPGESHPGPKHADGTFVGRGAPEIDLFEAQIELEEGPPHGRLSMSAQWAPFNEGYQWFNTSENLIIMDPNRSNQNVYTGGAYQQSTSVVYTTNQDCYQMETGCFSTYAFEYKPGFDNAYIHWIADNEIVWVINSGGLAADTGVEISARPVSREPMYIIMNLAMANGFQKPDFKHLVFPSVMRVDWIRIYQRTDAKNIGCDPPNMPTAAYINRYIHAYTNPNLTSFTGDYRHAFPRNAFLGEC